jgi:hypothetical protein
MQEPNFIAACEAPAILQDMKNRILALAPGYFGHADFAARFIRKNGLHGRKYCGNSV